MNFWHVIFFYIVFATVDFLILLHHVQKLFKILFKTSSLYHYEDVSFFEDLSEGDQNDGRIVHFDAQVFVKILTSMD